MPVLDYHVRLCVSSFVEKGKKFLILEYVYEASCGSAVGHGCWLLWCCVVLLDLGLFGVWQRACTVKKRDGRGNDTI
jgi:hypothetical protein